mmetsp:Transcript_3422/g.7768  ORF Transcript_3422/g.7768 Transcript_3422/m.7768 type:complete len:257 (-) Transcript_3422:76-846(-)
MKLGRHLEESAIKAFSIYRQLDMRQTTDFANAPLYTLPIHFLCFPSVHPLQALPLSSHAMPCNCPFSQRVTQSREYGVGPSSDGLPADTKGTAAAPPSHPWHTQGCSTTRRSVSSHTWHAVALSRAARLRFSTSCCICWRNSASSFCWAACQARRSRDCSWDCSVLRAVWRSASCMAKPISSSAVVSWAKVSVSLSNRIWLACISSTSACSARLASYRVSNHTHTERERESGRVRTLSGARAAIPGGLQPLRRIGP